MVHGKEKDRAEMGKQVLRQQTKQARRREEQQRRVEAQHRAARTKRLTTIGVIIVGVLIVALIAFVLVLRNQTPVNAAFPTTDGISCDSGEHSDFHIHAHLSLYINGKASPLPATIGIAPDQSCIYWLHTHASDGIIHIEAPAGQAFTLGNFLDIWQSRFNQLGSLPQVSETTGWQVYVDGKPFTGSIRTIPLQAHRLITLAYNSPGIRPDTTFNWNGL
jgi:hypothetical protein